MSLPPPLFPRPHGPWESDVPNPPPVLPWFRLYMGILVAAHLLMIVLGFSLGVMADSIAFASLDAFGLKMFGLSCVLAGFLLSLVFGATFFLPRTPWVWFFNLSALCLSVLAICCAPVGIVLFIFWAQKDVRSWYGIR